MVVRYSRGARQRVCVTNRRENFLFDFRTSFFDVARSTWTRTIETYLARGLKSRTTAIEKR